MAQNVTLNGVTYAIPNRKGERNWEALSQYLIATATGFLSKTGGDFELEDDLDFGGTGGLFAKFFSSRTSNAASAGILRLASADLVDWRNNANNANLALGKDSSDNLEWNGVDLVTVSGTQTLTNKTLTSPVINSPTINSPTITGFAAGGFAICFGGSNVTSAGTNPQYAQPAGMGDMGETEYGVIVPVNCRVKAVTSYTAQQSNVDWTVTVRKDAGDTAATYTHPLNTTGARGSGGAFEAVTFTAAQLLSVKCQPASTPSPYWAAHNVIVYLEAT